MSLETTDLDERLIAVPGRRPPDVAQRIPAIPSPRGPQGPGTGRPSGATRPPAAQSHLGRPGAAAAGGMVPTDDDLLVRTLRFSGSFVSDDGHVSVRRAPGGMSYSAARFVGRCDVCARAGRTPLAGEPLADVRVAVQFVARHEHGDRD